MSTVANIENNEIFLEENPEFPVIFVAHCCPFHSLVSYYFAFFSVRRTDLNILNRSTQLRLFRKRRKMQNNATRERGMDNNARRMWPYILISIFVPYFSPHSWHWKRGITRREFHPLPRDKRYWAARNHWTMAYVTKCTIVSYLPITIKMWYRIITNKWYQLGALRISLWN